MKRQWFQDTDGTYYRNCPLIRAEIDRARTCPWLWHHIRGLEAEWWEVFREGVTRKDKLGHGDRDAGQPSPFREAYPNNPGLWMLDDPTFKRPIPG